MSRAQIIHEIAMRRWKRREAGFPAFVRRLMPDALDRATGTWAKCVSEAEAEYVLDHGATAGTDAEERR